MYLVRNEPTILIFNFKNQSFPTFDSKPPLTNFLGSEGSCPLDAPNRGLKSSTCVLVP